MSWRLDEADPTDADALAAMLTEWARETAWLARPDTPAEDRRRCLELIAAGRVRLLRGPGGIAGFLAREHDFVAALHVAAPWRRQGFGARLLDDAKALSPGRLWLWTFQANEGARRFFAREGFREAELTDGAGTDEGLPDVKMIWEAA